MVLVSLFAAANAPVPTMSSWSLDDFARNFSEAPVRRDLVEKAEVDLETIRLLVQGERFRDCRLTGAFRSIQGRRPDLKPEKVGDILADSVLRKVKALLPAWSPATYEPEATRSASAVQQVTALVLDIDHGATIDQVWSLWPRNTRFLYTSWNHSEQSPKFRLAVPLLDPVSSLAWDKTWRAARFHAAAAAGVAIDATCKNPDRIYFLPARQWTGQPFEYREYRGSLLDLRWRNIPDPAPPAPFRESRARPEDAEHHPRKDRYNDAVERLALAESRRFRVTGEGMRAAAHRIPCPGCGRHSALYHIESKGWAWCHHLNSCTWRGPLTALE